MYENDKNCDFHQHLDARSRSSRALSDEYSCLMGLNNTIKVVVYCVYNKMQTCKWKVINQPVANIILHSVCDQQNINICFRTNFVCSD